jgi:hypothetical protein
MRFAATSDGFNVNYVEVVSVPTGAESDGRSARVALYPCYPNPFNPTTTIGYEVRERVPVTLAIYDVGGKRVKTLADGESTGTGYHEKVWDGRNEAGRVVSSGVYFYRLEAGGYTETRRMVLLK